MNFNIIYRQKLLLTITVLFAALISLIPFSKPLKPKDLKLNLNKASYYQLLDIPYIGKKTAKEILKLRKQKGRFYSLEELKSVRNFKRFKLYIKVE